MKKKTQEEDLKEKEEEITAESDCTQEECEKNDDEAKAVEEDADTKYLRLLADFQNYKKRIEKEKADIYSFANEQIVTEMLPILDNFERALASECQDEKYSQGMANIFKLLYKILEKNGLSEIEALGTDFDPNFHAAVATEDSEEYESGKVSSVLQKGYKLKEKVIRPSMVKVAN